jgi:hypothetical protein
MELMASLRITGSTRLLALASLAVTVLGAAASGCQSGELASPDGGAPDASQEASSSGSAGSSGGESSSGSGGKGGGGASSASSSGGGSTSTGAAIVTLATGQGGFALAVDATRVYWANAGTYEGSALDGAETYCRGR